MHNTALAKTIESNVVEIRKGGLNSLNSLNSQPKQEQNKPKLADEALHGVFGDVIRKIEPFSEASVPAMLFQFLSAFGVLLGRGPYFAFGRDRHYLKLNTVLVGPSGSGRKGTSWGEVLNVLSKVDEGFPGLVVSGLSSGEGLISLVRDPSYKKTAIKEKGLITGYQDELEDQGATEKRCFVQESEFSRVIKACGREGSVLSEVLRDSFDRDTLRVMTKTKLVATDVHIAFVGHITNFELLREMDDVSKANGFGNRILWVHTERSKALPFGGEMPIGIMNEQISRLRFAYEFGRGLGEMRRTPAADDLWGEIYEPLTGGYTGMMDALCSRATAHVMRAACLFAIGDQSAYVDDQHLKAALAIWYYAEASARFIFGSSTGDRTSDTILSALRNNPDGLTKTEISHLLGRHVKGDVLTLTMDRLERLGQLQSVRVKTEGAPRTIYLLSSCELSEKSELRGELPK